MPIDGECAVRPLNGIIEIYTKDAQMCPVDLPPWNVPKREGEQKEKQMTCDVPPLLVMSRLFRRTRKARCFQLGKSGGQGWNP